MRWSLRLPWEQLLCEFKILPLSSRALTSAIRVNSRCNLNPI